MRRNRKQGNSSKTIRRNRERRHLPQEELTGRRSSHTGETYYAKYINGGNASLNRLLRLRRLERRDALIAAALAALEEATAAEEVTEDA